MFNRNFGPQDGPVCCFCIPMKIGIILMFLCLMMDTFETLKMANNFAQVSQMVMYLYYVALVPQLFSIAMFLNYFCRDNYKNRNNLIMACAIMIMSVGLEYVAVILGVIFVEDIPLSMSF